MATITGIWDRLPEHGAKPDCVLRCEKIEREISDAEVRIRALRETHRSLLTQSMNYLSMNWTRAEIGQAIFPDSLDLADHMPNQ